MSEIHTARPVVRSLASRGFTIVELLIVIVVIGILAAIIIVAYAGVTKQANASASKGNAVGVQKVAEAYTADPAQSGSYPAAWTNLRDYTGTTRIPSGVTLKDPAASASWTADPAGVLNSKTNIIYKPLATAANGGCVVYWDFNASAAASIFVGAAKTATFTGGAATPTAVACT